MESNTQATEGTERDNRSAGPPGQSPLLSLQIVWAALLLSLGMYVVLSFVLAKSRAAGELPAPLPVMQLAFGLISLSSLAVAFVLSRKLFQQAIGKEDPANLTIDKLTRLAFTPWIIRMAMTESVGILGFLLSFLTGEPSSGMPFLAISALVMLTHLPNEKALRNAAQSS